MKIIGIETNEDKQKIIGTVTGEQTEDLIKEFKLKNNQDYWLRFNDVEHLCFIWLNTPMPIGKKASLREINKIFSATAKIIEAIDGLSEITALDFQSNIELQVNKYTLQQHKGIAQTQNKVAATMINKINKGDYESNRHADATKKGIIIELLDIYITGKGDKTQARAIDFCVKITEYLYVDIYISRETIRKITKEFIT